ncbi:hypothetical protein KAR91_25775 [Candidatus Pacearchaeota archaeon]|nr:hypothetical protein [Candidatus Pacearchaeota archaeon]
MAKERDSFIFYRSFFEAISELPDKDRLLLFTAISEYSLNFKEIQLTGIPKTIFILIKPQLDANNKRFMNGIKPKIKAKDKQTISKNEANNNVNENVNNNENIIKYQKDFYNLLTPFVKEFGKDIIREFYDYWSEPNKSKTKIRQQLERTWDTKRRLQRWQKNSDEKNRKFNNKGFESDSTKRTIESTVRTLREESQ